MTVCIVPLRSKLIDIVRFLTGVVPCAPPRETSLLTLSNLYEDRCPAEALESVFHMKLGRFGTLSIIRRQAGESCWTSTPFATPLVATFQAYLCRVLEFVFHFHIFFL